MQEKESNFGATLNGIYSGKGKREIFEQTAAWKEYVLTTSWSEMKLSLVGTH